MSGWISTHCVRVNLKTLSTWILFPNCLRINIIPLFSVQFIVQASDGRDPENTANATITVTITRDESIPYFVDGPYDDAKVSENAEVGVDFYSKLRAQDSDMQV